MKANDDSITQAARFQQQGQPPTGDELASLEDRLRAAAAAEGQQSASDIDLEALDDATIIRLLAGLEGTLDNHHGPANERLDSLGTKQDNRAARPDNERDPLTGVVADMFDGGLPGEFFEIRIPPIITAFLRGGETAVQDHVRSLGMPEDVVAQVLTDLPMLLQQVDIPQD